VEDVAVLVEQQRPDLLLMQEATAPLDALPALIGGCFHRLPLPARIHGLATWSPHELTPPSTLALPESRMPGRMPPRLAQVVRIGGITLANVHLSHGQILNRQQLACIVRSIDGAAAVIGDYNAVGPVLLPGFRDVGPRAPTHVVRNVLPFRLDRCLVRGVLCANACVLERGSSDHRPIMIELAAAQQSVPIYAGRLGAARRRSVKGRIARTPLARIWNGLGAKSGLRLSMRRAVGKLSSGLIVAGSSKRLCAYTGHRNRAIAGKETA
jgi:endonuclease/exonuclease/phosphatase family metal-dependent hydrolase